MEIIKLPYNFTPRPYQREIMQQFFIEKKRRMILIQHRRAGKDLLCFNMMIAAALQRVGTYVYALPLMKQARKVIWEGMDKAGVKFVSYVPPHIVESTHDTKMSIYLKNGSIITLTGSDNYDALMGTNPIGLVLSEFSLQHPNVWRYMSPILRENGGWAIFNGTPRGHNHAYDLYHHNVSNPDWYVKTHNIETTEIVPGVPVVSLEAIEEEIRGGMSEELIQQEYYCSFDMPIPGSYYSKQLAQCIKEERIYDFTIDPKQPVFTFWDLGHKDAAAISFFQVIGNEIKIINYYEKRRQTMRELSVYVHDFGKKYNLNYKMHFAPHDLLQSSNFGDAKARKAEALACGISFRVVSTTDHNKKKIKVIEGINAVRYLFSRFHFHKTNCYLLIQSLMHYHSEYHELTDHYTGPKHDWSCHGADTIRYFAMIWSGRFTADNSMMNTKEPISYKSGWD